MAAAKGNQYAAKDRKWREAICRALARASNETTDAGLDRMATKLVNAALEGDQWAIMEIGNRIDGKPAQAVTVQGDEEGGPVRFERIQRVIVHGGAQDTDG